MTGHQNVIIGCGDHEVIQAWDTVTWEVRMLPHSSPTDMTCQDQTGLLICYLIGNSI
jgi:hypothetical protein